MVILDTVVECTVKTKQSYPSVSLISQILLTALYTPVGKYGKVPPLLAKPVNWKRDIYEKLLVNVL